MKGYILFLPQLIGVVTVNLQNHNWRCNYLKVLKNFFELLISYLKKKSLKRRMQVCRGLGCGNSSDTFSFLSDC